MHPPAHINVQQVDQFISPLGVGVSADGREQRGDGDVRADNGVEDPFQPEVGYSSEVVREGVEGTNCDCGRWGQPFAAEEAEEGGFAGTVGCGIDMSMRAVFIVVVGNRVSESENEPPIRRTLLPSGIPRETSSRPLEPSGNLYVRSLTWMEEPWPACVVGDIEYGVSV